MLIHVCDCGKQKQMDEADLVPMGVEGRLYCKGECQERIQQYLDDRDELHDKVQKVWESGIKNLKKVHGHDMELPDAWTKE